MLSWHESKSFSEVRIEVDVKPWVHGSTQAGFCTETLYLCFGRGMDAGNRLKLGKSSKVMSNKPGLWKATLSRQWKMRNEVHHVEGVLGWICLPRIWCWEWEKQCLLSPLTIHNHKPAHVFLFFVFWFFLLRRVACRILVTRPGIKLVPAAVEARSPNH